MKKKRFMYIILSLILAYLLLYLIVPKFGRIPTKTILIKRIERLEIWRQGVQYYIQDNNRVPTSLFEVYNYCNKNKKGVDLRLTILSFNSAEESLLKTGMILEDEKVFVKNIDYEFISTEKNWFVREKKAYPGYFSEREFLAVDSKCYIYQTPLENRGQLPVK